MKYIIGNWKANKTIEEVRDWIKTFKRNNLYLINSTRLIICPPTPFVTLLSESFASIKWISIGAQDVSVFEGGTYTGEVTAYMLRGLITHVIIGHSERRKFCKESEEDIQKKIHLAKKNGIEPILCIRSISDKIYEDVTFVAYEQPEAISTGSGIGKNVSIEHVLNVKNSLPINQNHVFIYGGSSNEENAHSYLSENEIDGLLPGGASLNPARLYSMVTIADSS